MVRDLDQLYKKNRRGIMLVISSPSGAGKTSLSRAILEQDNNIKLSISMTTRKPRPKEIDGRDYYFTDRESFEAYQKKELFLETAYVFGNYYGTPKQAVDSALSKGYDILFDIDWQGAQQLSQTASDHLVKVFILPPNLSTLETRLKNRAEDNDNVIKSRMDKALEEMSHWAEYDYILVNDNFEDTLAKLIKIIEVERLQRYRQLWIQDFVKQMINSNI